MTPCRSSGEASAGIAGHHICHEAAAIERRLPHTRSLGARNLLAGCIAPRGVDDLVIGLKGAKPAALYLFDDFLQTSTPGGADGTYTVALANPGGQTPDLSNITLFGRVGAPPPPTDVPEPMSLAILGIGLLGLGYVARRRKHAA